MDTEDEKSYFQKVTTHDATVKQPVPQKASTSSVPRGKRTIPKGEGEIRTDATYVPHLSSKSKEGVRAC